MYGNTQPRIPARETLPGYLTQGRKMKTKLAMTCIAFGALLGSAAVIAGDDANAVGTSTAVFVKDSAITAKIKPSSLPTI